MGERCKICGINTIFYIWSTSRNFPREKLGSLLDLEPEFIDTPVCFQCCKKYLNYPEDKDEEL